MWPGPASLSRLLIATAFATAAAFTAAAAMAAAGPLRHIMATAIESRAKEASADRHLGSAEALQQGYALLFHQPARSVGPQ
mmetsp:Transcript_43879/g.101408  ORF Transcript_43879/g.101408 Transcript_43879/m.101408 type:complete len:81 (+) Transcript_43879:22-264(+)